MLYIYDHLVNRLQSHLDKLNIPATIKANIGRAWHCYRYIQVCPNGITDSVHYEYINGYWELHFENIDSIEESENLRRKVMEHISSDGYWAWHRKDGSQKGYLNINKIVDEDTFLSMFDKLYNSTIKLLVDNTVPENNIDSSKQKSIEILDNENELERRILNNEYQEPAIYLSSVEDLEFDRFCIPPYQRPYRWGIKEVNQFINDIITFHDDNTNEYRLGTLVLHQCGSDNSSDLDIVDGQQRTITLILILNELATLYPDLLQNINISTFLNKKLFHESVSKAHLRENLNAIRYRIADITKDNVRFLLKKCKFVIVKLFDISEAFQFFDSQNARGKELEPHDLLKAFHLRSIPFIFEEEKSNIKFWESLDINDLSNLFLILFRIKRWVQGMEGREFTSKHVDTFKGPYNLRYNYPYQRIYALAECYKDIYNADRSRRIDNQHMEFPHQIDQITINGSLFFDMIRHYSKIENEVKNLLKKECEDIHNAIHLYKDNKRQGDIYTRCLFYAALIFYYDKFGNNGFKAAVPKILAWAYEIRINHYAVRLATMDNHARSDQGFFKMLHRAISPSDILNWNICPIKGGDSIQVERLGELVNILTKYKYFEQ